jgi:hypothetical protein
LCLLVLLGWFAFRQEPLPLDRQPVKAEPTKPQAREFELADDVSSETPTNQPNNSAITNAADLYRQAFALYDALSKDEKGLLGDWRTNVDASVEAERCGKLHPICDLMHQASAVTNCDWGIEQITLETKLPHIKQARDVSRAALWNAAHCRSNDVTGATDDAVAVLRLGQRVSRTSMLACLADMALQNMASSYIAQNVGLFAGTDSQRLVAAFRDPAYEETPSRVEEQEADVANRLAAKLTAMSEVELKKELSKLESFTPPNASELDQAATLVALKQIADSDRELAKALASSSEDEYKAWLQHLTELKTSNPLANAFLGGDEVFVDKVRQAEVNREMIVAGLAVAENGPEALSTHPDSSSGQPFVYTETPDGFELRSTYQMSGKPMTMQFKQPR